MVHVHPRFTVLLTTLGQPIKPMCQESIQLVWQPLPMYPHVKTIQIDAEGMEVATLLKGYNSLQLGHGTTTSGKDLEETVMYMLQLEEQERMNYYALRTLGSNYPSIPDALIAEISGRTPLAKLPHFKDPIARASEEPRVGGVCRKKLLV